VNFETYVALGTGAVLLIITAFVAYKKFPRKVNQQKFVEKWKRLQQRCSDETQWALAVVEADDLLAEALKKKRFKGKGVGERLVEAQKHFSDNDAVWFGHKLRTKIDMNPELHLNQAEVQKALVGLRQGLKDIGAL
jgi:hypothetical protein